MESKSIVKFMFYLSCLGGASGVIGLVAGFISHNLIGILINGIFGSINIYYAIKFDKALKAFDEPPKEG